MIKKAGLGCYISAGATNCVCCPDGQGSAEGATQLAAEGATACKSCPAGTVAT